MSLESAAFRRRTLSPSVVVHPSTAPSVRRESPAAVSHVMPQLPTTAFPAATPPPSLQPPPETPIYKSALSPPHDGSTRLVVMNATTQAAVRRVGLQAGAYALFVVMVVYVVVWMCHLSGVRPVRFAHLRELSVSETRQEVKAGDLWMELSRRRGRTGSATRIMFVGDSITDGSASGTKHPRFFPNGSCSYRYPFLSILTDPRSGLVSSQNDVETVGPFSSNCGSDRVPSRCWTLWGPVSDQSRWTNHAATSGVTAKGLMQDRETWAKRALGYAKAGWPELNPPPVSAAVTDTEVQFRSLFGLAADAPATQSNVTNDVDDVAVWSTTFRPDIAVVLLGTNDLRHGRSWRDVLERYIPEVVWSVLRYSHGMLPNVTGVPSWRKDVVSATLNEMNRPATSSLDMCTVFVVVSTLVPRDTYVEEVQSFNEGLLKLQALRRKRQEGSEGSSTGGLRIRRGRNGAAGDPCSANNVVGGELSPIMHSPVAFDDGRSSLPAYAWSKLLLCHPCVRVVDGGNTVAIFDGKKPSATENGQEERHLRNNVTRWTQERMDWNTYVKRFTFDGLHPNDEGEENLAKQMLLEIYRSNA